MKLKNIGLADIRTKEGVFVPGQEMEVSFNLGLMLKAMFPKELKQIEAEDAPVKEGEKIEEIIPQTIIKKRNRR